MDIFESLENLNVSEECFDDIMGIVEEYINELKAPTPELAKKVFDRKANQLEQNTKDFQHMGKMMNTPIKNTVSKNTKVGDLGKLAKANQEYEHNLHLTKKHLTNSGQRLRNWAVTQKQKGKLTDDMKNAVNNMVHKGQEHARVTSGF